MFSFRLEDMFMTTSLPQSQLFNFIQKLRLRPKPSITLSFKNLANSMEDPIVRCFALQDPTQPIYLLKRIVTKRLKSLGLIDGHIRRVNYRFLSRIDLLTFPEDTIVTPLTDSNDRLGPFFRHEDATSNVTTNIHFEIEYGPHNPLDINHVIQEMTDFCLMTTLPKLTKENLEIGEDDKEIFEKDFRVFILPEIHFKEKVDALYTEVNQEEIEVLTSDNQVFLKVKNLLNLFGNGLSMRLLTTNDQTLEDIDSHIRLKETLHVATRVDATSISEVYQVILTIEVVNGQIAIPFKYFNKLSRNTLNKVILAIKDTQGHFIDEVDTNSDHLNESETDED